MSGISHEDEGQATRILVMYELISNSRKFFVAFDRISGKYLEFCKKATYFVHI